MTEQTEPTPPSLHPPRNQPIEHSATPPAIDRLAALPKLGVGLSFQSTMHEFALAHLPGFDFLEIIPDTFWTDHG
ncbi:MAG: DUF692 domain-containing protein, partial [Acidobacteriota bacterium]|nr:DUF692 domain-containing protein [Acidobacteriota bacterium]